jgi:hypothetical protein
MTEQARGGREVTDSLPLILDALTSVGREFEWPAPPVEPRRCHPQRERPQPEAPVSEAASCSSAERPRITHRFISDFCQALADWRKEIVFTIGDWEIGRTTISLFDDAPDQAGAEPFEVQPPQYVNAPVDASVHDYWDNRHRQSAAEREASPAPKSDEGSLAGGRVAERHGARADAPTGRLVPSSIASPVAGPGTTATGFAVFDLFGGTAAAAEDEAPKPPSSGTAPPPETFYRRGGEESEEAWQHRLFDESAAAEHQLWSGDSAVAAAAAARLAEMKAAIEEDRDFLDKLPAYSQDLDPDFYADPQRWAASHGLPADALKEAPRSAGDLTPDKVDPVYYFIRNNGVRYYKIAADGKIYDISETAGKGADPRLARLPVLFNIYSHLADQLTKYRIRNGDPDAYWDAMLALGLEPVGNLVANPWGLGSPRITRGPALPRARVPAEGETPETPLETSSPPEKGEPAEARGPTPPEGASSEPRKATPSAPLPRAEIVEPGDARDTAEPPAKNGSVEGNPPEPSPPTGANPKYFTSETMWTAPENGTGQTYKVYQQDIDWNLKVENITNLERAEHGWAPYVVKDGDNEKLELHHSRQDGTGPLYELSTSTHRAKRGHGRDALHPYRNRKHPDTPVDRSKFETDKRQYWRDRAVQAQKSGAQYP